MRILAQLSRYGDLDFDHRDYLPDASRHLAFVRPRASECRRIHLWL